MINYLAVLTTGEFVSIDEIEKNNSEGINKVILKNLFKTNKL